MFHRNILERNILFLCQDNSSTSQMAEAVAKRLVPPKTRIFSAGLTPGTLHHAAVEVMQEVGIDISTQIPKGLEAIPMDEIDLVVSLGIAKDDCPLLPGKARLECWSFPSAQRFGEEKTAVRAALRYVRDEIDKKVAALFLDYWRNVA